MLSNYSEYNTNTNYMEKYRKMFYNIRAQLPTPFTHQTFLIRYI